MHEGMYACYDVVTNNDTDRDTAAENCAARQGHLLSTDSIWEIKHVREILDDLMNSTNISSTDVFYTELKWDGIFLVYADGSSLDIPVCTTF